MYRVGIKLAVLKSFFFLPHPPSFEILNEIKLK